MYNDAVMRDIDFIKKHRVSLAVSVFLLCATMGLAMQPTGPLASELTFRDPHNANNYMRFNPADHSFVIHDSNSKVYSGTYTETSETYGLKYNEFGGQTVLKEKGGVITPTGNHWTRKY